MPVLSRTTGDGDGVPAAESRPALLPLALVSAATLALEVFVTKVLAYSLPIVLLYVVLGIALLGFGAAGSLVAVRRHWIEPDRLPAALAWAALSFVVLLIGALALFVRLTPVLASSNALALVIAGLLTLPFLSAGVVVTLALSATGENAGRCYAANLVGSGVGCFLPLVLLGPLDGAQFLAGLSLLAWVAAALYVWRSTPRRPLRSPLGVAAGLVLALAVASNVAAERVFVFQPEPAPFGAVTLVHDLAAKAGVRVDKVFDRWNATERIEIFAFSNVPGGPTPYPYLLYTQDSFAGSMLIRWDGRTRSKVRPTRRTPGTNVARMCMDTLYGQAFYRRRRRALVIGVGGGPDLQCALYHEAELVDVVEINPDSVAAIQGPFNGWLGGIGQHPAVWWHVRDGRSFVHSTSERYDVVQLTGAGTKELGPSAGLALSENLLHTQEALVDYLRVLRPSGVVSVLRFGEAEALRLVNTAVAALRELGAARPGLHLAVFRTSALYGILVRRQPFTVKEVQALRAHFGFRDRPHRGFNWFFYGEVGLRFDRPPEILYTPGFTDAPLFAAFFDQVARGDTAPFEEQYPFNISPVVDDRPYFSDITRYDRPGAWEAPHVVALAHVLVSVVLLSAILILLPVWSFGRSATGKTRLVALAFFASIGLAYLLVEVWLLHRFGMFLGHQTYALSVVLSVMLVSTGIGALVGERRIPEPVRRVRIGVLVIGLVLGAGVLGLTPILEAARNVTFAGRMLIVAAYVAPLGFFMGFPFPAGLRWAARTLPAAVPWCVGINAFASVLATVAITPLVIALGYPVLLLAGVLLYGGAVLAAMGMRGSGPAAPAGSPASSPSATSSTASPG